MSIGASLIPSKDAIHIRGHLRSRLRKLSGIDAPVRPDEQGSGEHVRCRMSFSG